MSEYFSLLRANIFVVICSHLRCYPDISDREIIAVLVSLLTAYRRGAVRRLDPQRERHPADLAFLFARARNRPDVIDAIMRQYIDFSNVATRRKKLFLEIAAVRWRSAGRGCDA